MKDVTLKDRHVLRDAPSARTYDDNGFLHVKATPITKEQIVGYYGHELPGNGLEPDREYMFYRPMSELKKGADTFNGLPIMDEHHTTTAEDSKPFFKVGTMMNNVHADDPYLRGDAVVHDGDAIDKINDGSQRELSAQYKSKLDMTPGSFKGQPYDGVIRNIRGNHVALVPEGRAGPDVHMRDAKMADKETPGQQAEKDVEGKKPAIVQTFFDTIKDLGPDGMTDDQAKAAGYNMLASLTSEANTEQESGDTPEGDTSEAEDAVPVEEVPPDPKDPQEDEPEDMQDEKTGEGIKDFLDDADAQMKKDGYDDKTRKMCLGMCHKAAEKASGDDSTARDADHEDCSETKDAEHKDSKPVEKIVDEAIMADRKRESQAQEARSLTAHTLGNTTLSDAASIYRAGLEQNGFNKEHVASIKDTNALKAMFELSDRKPAPQLNTIFSDSAGDDLSKYDEILAKRD